MDLSSTDLRNAFLRAIHEEWKSVVDVNTEEGEKRVTEYFQWIGWQWNLDANFDGAFSEEIRKNTGEGNYCGIGPAAVGVRLLQLHVKDGMCYPVALDPGLANFVLPSTRRIADREKWRQAGVEMVGQFPPEDLRPGDLAMVRTRRQNPYIFGDHIVVVRDHIHEGKLPTYEFNATGELGNGVQGRGLVRRTRPLSTVRNTLRLERRCFQVLTEEINDK